MSLNQVSGLVEERITGDITQSHFQHLMHSTRQQMIQLQSCKKRSINCMPLASKYFSMLFITTLAKVVLVDQHSPLRELITTLGIAMTTMEIILMSQGAAIPLQLLNHTVCATLLTHFVGGLKLLVLMDSASISRLRSMQQTLPQILL